MKQEEKNEHIVFDAKFYFIVSVVLTIFLVYLIADGGRLNIENQLYKVILKMDSEYSKVSLDDQTAQSYYNEANSAYESGKYDLVQSNCRLARDYFFKESQGYKNMKSELIAYDINDKLIDLYSDELDQEIIISDSLYEACEHFESAANYYSQGNYDMGTAEINTMNIKIANHDEAVKIYNQDIADFNVELEKRLGK
jgi:hypothetical protein